VASSRYAGIPLLFCPALLLVVWTAGCERSASPTPPKAPATQTAMAECLPCAGHRIEVTMSTPRVEYKGKTYYFCSNGCRETFLKNPEKYVAKPPSTVPATRPEATMNFPTG
jgi:YHS domain-containing protein